MKKDASMGVFGNNFDYPEDYRIDQNLFDLQQASKMEHKASILPPLKRLPVQHPI